MEAVIATARHADSIGAAGRVGSLDAEATLDPNHGSDFERLVRLVRENERMAAELDAIRTQTLRAWTFVTRSGNAAEVARVHLDRLRRQRSAILARLRANRVEARALLGDEPVGASSDEDLWRN